VNSAEAAQREEDFVQAFEAHARACASLPNPLDGKRYAIAAGTYREQDRARELIEALKKRHAFSREAVARYPLTRVASLRIGRRFSRYELLVVAASLTRFEAYLDAEAAESGAPPPLGAADAVRYLSSMEVGPKTFAVFGLLSASGWRPGTVNDPDLPQMLCLTAPEPRGTWRLETTLSQELQEFRWFFDPEGRDGRLDRMCRAVLERPELKVAGGFRAVEDVRAELGADPSLWRLALDRILAAEPQLSVVVMDGVSILKRMRT
jgi:hypothetical protein